MNCPDQLKDLEMELTPEKLISITSYKSHDQLTEDDSVSIDTALIAIEMARKEEKERIVAILEEQKNEAIKNISYSLSMIDKKMASKYFDEAISKINQ